MWIRNEISSSSQTIYSDTCEFHIRLYKAHFPFSILDAKNIDKLKRRPMWTWITCHAGIPGAEDSRRVIPPPSDCYMIHISSSFQIGNFAWILIINGAHGTRMRVLRHNSDIWVTRIQLNWNSELSNFFYSSSLSCSLHCSSRRFSYSAQNHL